MVFFGEIHVLLQCRVVGLFGKNEAISNMKILIFRKYSFQKLTQFTQGNNVLYAASPT
jgi:hypothetical protein